MIKIRTLKPTDVKAVAAIHRECWRVAYKGVLPQNYLDSLSLESFERRWTNGLLANPDVVRLLALEKSVPVGFVAGLENLTPEKCPEASGELWALYVHPSHWEKGIGKLLFREFQEVMKGRGHKRIFLWTLEQNHRGRAFYEALGGKLYPTTQDFKVREEAFPLVAYLF